MNDFTLKALRVLAILALAICGSSIAIGTAVAPLAYA